MERDVTAMHEYGLWATLDKSDKCAALDCLARQARSARIAL
jgi:hypothetical protein